jgi:hypothetical protein
LPEIIEALESRQIATSGGRGTGKRVFHVSGYTNPATIFQSFGNGTLPTKGDQHPDFPGLIATDFSLSLVGGHSDLWKLEWTYEVISTSFAQYPVLIPPTVLPNEVSYTEVSSNIRAEFAPAWRASPSYPSNGDVLDSTLDIQGDPIDAAGNPVSVQRNIQELTITETVNTPAWSTYSSYQFSRNSAAFLGAVIGSVLYKGTSVRRTGVNVYQVSHTFVYASDYHLIQTPLIDQDGEAIRKNNRKHADEVYFIQPFPTKKNFNLISSNF